MGQYQPEPEQNECLNCVSPEVTTEVGQSSCRKCDLGTAYENTAKCHICQSGSYRDDTTEKACKQCTDGSVAPSDGTVTCTVCAAVSLVHFIVYFIVYFRSII